MKNLLILATMLITFGFANAQTNCSGHENDIKNGQIKKALSMNMTVNSIIVKYLGNCQYMCISDVDDPGTAYSAAQKLNTNTIFKWENNKYVFVRKGKTICDCLKDDGTNKKECDDLGNRLSKAEIDSEIDKCK